jgi:Raf kinase inhibitor-like YbhB/YbcL family protein
MNLTHTLRSVFLGMPKMLRGQPAERAGVERLARHRLELGSVTPLVVSSPAFASGRLIPVRNTQDGDSLSPPLRWGAVPERTRSLALIVEDPDAPTPEPFVHWLAANLSPEQEMLSEGLPGAGVDLAVQGRHTMLGTGYLGCAPPRGDVPHHYHFQLFALDTLLDLEPGFGRTSLLRAIQGHVVGFGETVGLYVRPD